MTTWKQLRNSLDDDGKRILDRRLAIHGRMLSLPFWAKLLLAPSVFWTHYRVSREYTNIYLSVYLASFWTKTFLMGRKNEQ